MQVGSTDHRRSADHTMQRPSLFPPKTTVRDSSSRSRSARRRFAHWKREILQQPATENLTASLSSPPVLLKTGGITVDSFDPSPSKDGFGPAEDGWSRQ